MDASILKALKEKEPGLAVSRALSRLLQNDRYLLECDANERSIAHHFAVYLQEQLPDWRVDCEYNRDGVEPKRIRHFEINPDEFDTDAKTVYPDVIAHKRGTKSNYLVIEIKKSNSTVDRDVDLTKLSGYKHDLGYTYALFIELRVGAECGVSQVLWVEE